MQVWWEYWNTVLSGSGQGLALGEFDKEKVIYLLKRKQLQGDNGHVCGAIVSILAQVILGKPSSRINCGYFLFFTIIIASLSGTIIPFIIHL